MLAAAYLPGMEREERSADLEQYYTDPRVAQRLWDWCPRRKVGGPWRVCEPAAGRGALLLPMIADPDGPTHVVAYDVDEGNAAALAVLFTSRAPGVYTTVRCRDFRQDPDPGCFDLVVMNPPFTLATDFIERGLEIAPVVVALLPASVEYGTGRWDDLWRWVDPVRKATLSSRPSFGGDHGPKTDFCAMELRARTTPRAKGEPMTMSQEWW